MVGPTMKKVITSKWRRITQILLHIPTWDARAGLA